MEYKYSYRVLVLSVISIMVSLSYGWGQKKESKSLQESNDLIIQQNIYLLSGNIDGAFDLIATTTSKFPEILDTWYLSAQIRNQKKDYYGAVEDLRKARKLGQKDEVDMLYAEMLEKIGEYPEAQKVLADLYKRHPRNSEIVNDYISILLKNQDWNTLEKVSENYFAYQLYDDKKAKFLYLKVYNGLKTLPNGQARAETYKKEHPEFNLYLTEDLKETPNVQALTSWSQAFQSGDKSNIIKAIQALWTDNSSVEVIKVAVNQSINSGMDTMASRVTVEELLRLTSASKNAPEWVLPAIQQYLYQHKIQNGVSELVDAYLKGHESDQAIWKVGLETLLPLDETTQFKKKLDLFSDYFPDNWMTEYYQAQLDIKEKQWKSALAHANRSMELSNMSALKMNNDELLHVATLQMDAYNALGNTSELDNWYNLLPPEVKSNRTLMNNYAYLLYEQKRDLRKAELLSSQVVSEGTSNINFLDTHAAILLLNGNPAKALTTVKSMNEIIKDFPVALQLEPVYHTMAEVYYANGDKNMAMIYYKKAQSVKPNEMLQKLINKLENE